MLQPLSFAHERMLVELLLPNIVVRKDLLRKDFSCGFDVINYDCTEAYANPRIVINFCDLPNKQVN